MECTTCNPDVACADPSAPIVPCANVQNCAWHVHTCEREVAEDSNYLCPAHPDGIEQEGKWFCNATCYYEWKWESGDPIVQAALRDARAHRLSPDSETYRALVEAGMVGDKR